MDIVYLTYYSVSSLIGMALGLSLGAYFMTSKGGSSAMRHLSIILVCAGMMNVAYLISSTLYTEMAALHRWITVPIGIAMSAHPVHLFLHYPDNRWPRFSKWLLVVQYVALALATALFVFVSSTAPRTFHFDGHYWDLVVDQPTKIVGAVILLNTVLQLIVAIVKIVVTKGRQRWTLIGILIFLFGCGFAQGVTNSLSRQGAISRDIFQTTFALTVVLGLFSVTVIFINNTKDRTTFMAKLIGISGVTLLFVMEMLSFFVLRERARAYDILRLQEARAVVRGRAEEASVVPIFMRTADGKPVFLGPGDAFRTAALPPVLVSGEVAERKTEGQKGEGQAEEKTEGKGKEVRQREPKSDLKLGRFRKAEAEDGRPLKYVSYTIGEGSEATEVAFPYLSYRNYVHDGARTLAILLLVVVAFLVGGFPLFFRGALIRPLMGLLGAVRRVDQGDLDAKVDVRVEDEIGQLAHYFNGMVVSIREARAKLQEYAEHLEEKVRERTAELEETLSRVQQLKDQQDGDYFLTSLLLRPLGTNRANSETVNIDFLVKQKKSFSFRKWNDEIGGDLCMAESIRLKGRPHTVFLNADAMGKSMQGAGGALVLGAVLEAIVDRTMLSAQASSVHPERWLKNAFIELHKVFEVFDGSMLISLVLGLVDDETGIVYLINAEHPWSVLYRKGRASFAESDLDFRKLGTLGMQGSIFVKTIQLEPGDVLIAGSDGRDDILFEGEGGERILQSDENVFLRHVEAGEGDLERITESLTTEGELTDDLSLLRIGYREDHTPVRTSTHEETLRLYSEAREAFRTERYSEAVALLEKAGEADNREPHVLRLLAQCYLRLNAFDEALAAAEDYAYIRPADTEMLYLVSYCAGRLGRLEEAADFGERVRLREPDNSRYLLNLARVYTALGNQKRAREMVEKVLENEPENDRAQKMAEQLG